MIILTNFFRHLLLLGLKDGRILFFDQNVQGLMYFEMAISNGTIVDISYDAQNQRVLTRSDSFDAVFQVLS